MNEKVYAILKDKILSMLEESKKTGKLMWIKPWNANCPLAKPYYSEPDEYYKGINLLLNEPGEYMTYKMVSELHEKDKSIKLRKGAKQHTIYYYSFMEKKDDEGNILTDKNGEPYKIPFIRFYKVYNIDDIVNINSRVPYEYTEHSLSSNMKKADEYIKKYCELNGIDLQIKKGGLRAYYRPDTNSITIPDKSQYKSVREYYSTCFHEVSHSIDKKLGLIGDLEEEKNNRYATGELLAEITANILCNIFHVEDDETEKNNVAYINGWYDFLKDKKGSYIAQVANKATKAAMEFVDSVKLQLIKEKTEKIEHYVVSAEFGKKYIEIEKNDGSYEYNIFKFEDGSLKLLDSGWIEKKEEGSIFEVLQEIVEDYDILPKTIVPIDLDEFESLVMGNYKNCSKECENDFEIN